MSEGSAAWGDESSDAELITAARSGDSEAFGALYQRHSGAARTVARQYTRSSADAEDVVGDAFAKVYSIVRGGGGPDVAFRAYLFTVVRRLAHQRAESVRRVEPTDDMAAFESAFGHVSGVEDPSLAGFERGVVARAYGSLPERWQAVLWYTEIERLGAAQIAPLLGLTANGVAALAYRAREGLREAYLQQHLVAVPSDACRTVNGKLGAYVRGGLAKRETAHVREHLETCADCRDLVLELGDVNHGLRGIIAPLVLGVAGLGALASPLPVGVLGGVAAGAGAAAAGGGASAGSAAGSGALTGSAVGGSAAASGTTAGSLAGAGTASASAGATTAGVAAGSAGAAAGGAAGTGAAAAGAVTGSAAAGSVGSVATAGATAAGATAAGATAAGATAAGATAAGATAAGATAAGATAAGATAAGATAAGATAAGATAVGATAAGATAAGATVAGATAAGATVAGATGVAVVGATSASAVAGAGALVGAGAAATGGGAGALAAAGGLGGLVAALPGGVAGALTVGVVGVSLAVGGAIADETPRTPPVVAAPGFSAEGGDAGPGASGGPAPDSVVVGPSTIDLSDPEPGAGGGDEPPPPAPDTDPPADQVVLPPASGDRSPVVPAPVPTDAVDPAPLTPAALRLGLDESGVVLIPGSDNAITVTVTNTGQTDATDVRAAFVVPAGARVDTARSGGPDGWAACGDPARPGLCLPALAGGASSVVSAVVLVEPDVEFPIGSAIGVSVTGAGVEAAQGAVPAVVQPSPFAPVVSGPDAVDLTVGEPQTVRFTVTSTGRTPGRDVVASFSLPTGVGWAGSSGDSAPWDCAADGDSVTCRLAELAVPDTGTASVELTLTVVADERAQGVAGLGLGLTVSDPLGATASRTVPVTVTGAPEPTETVPPEDPGAPDETVPPAPDPPG